MYDEQHRNIDHGGGDSIKTTNLNESHPHLRPLPRAGGREEGSEGGNRERGERGGVVGAAVTGAGANVVVAANGDRVCAQ